MDSNLTTYQRLIRSSQAEQILGQAKICLEISKLRPHIIGEGVDKTSELYRYMKFASQNGGFISSEYSSKGKTTARMFTKKGSLNLITLSDERILDAMRSRYQDGAILCMDYQNFEPSIIASELGSVVPESIHDWACTLFPSIPRKEIKLWNMQLMYSSDFGLMMEKLHKTMKKGFDCEREPIEEYFQTFVQIREAMSEYVSSHLQTFEKSGYVVNSYGRKIYPKSQDHIFNNIIQSVGSEILVEAILALDEFIQNKELHLLFHRFDALYIDTTKRAVMRHLKDIKGIMEGVNQGINLKVGVEVGKTVATLKELDIG